MVCQFVKQIFSQSEKVEEVNKALIVLILKVSNSKFVKQFRPISLCNVIYKIITKIVAARLRSCMSLLSAPNQSSFVLARYSANNIIITQVIHSTRSKKGREGWMAIKVDLKKAYNIWIGNLLRILYWLLA